MNTDDLQRLLPLLTLATGAAVLMLQIAFARNVRLTSLLAVATLITAALSVMWTGESASHLVTPLLRADKLAIVFSALFCIAGAVTALLSMDYLNSRGDEPEEYFLLLVLSTLGACVLAYASHLASLLLGLELMSVSLYALIAYPDKTKLPLEAAIKYLVLSGAATATMLFGFALLYAMTGTLQFSAMAGQLASIDTGNITLLVASVMIVTGLGFKLSLVPFHMWTPDVYDGAPAPVTGYLASVGKAAVFVVLVRWFIASNLFRFSILIDCIALLAILSMLGGNLLALLQTNIKRMLAYSSIAHMGYLIIILVVASDTAHRALAIEAGMYYLIAYIATTIAAFGLLTLLSAGKSQRENIQLHDVSGLFWHQPLYACLMLVALLSLAGIPLTAGFVAKFYLLSSAVSDDRWALLGALVIGSSVGIYYYLRVVFYMTRRVEEHNNLPEAPHGLIEKVVSGTLIVSILLLGIAPQPLMEYLRSIL